MHDERPHRDDTASRADAVDRSNGVGCALDGVVSQHAARMSAGQYAKRTVRFRRVVEMNAERDPLLEHVSRRVGVEDSALYRPWSPRWVIDAAAQRKGGVLVPGHEPIRRGGFVEQRRAKRNRPIAKKLTGETQQVGLGRKRLNDGDPQDASRAGLCPV